MVAALGRPNLLQQILPHDVWHLHVASFCCTLERCSWFFKSFSNSSRAIKIELVHFTDPRSFLSLLFYLFIYLFSTKQFWVFSTVTKKQVMNNRKCFTLQIRISTKEHKHDFCFTRMKDYLLDQKPGLTVIFCSNCSLLNCICESN